VEHRGQLNGDCTGLGLSSSVRLRFRRTVSNTLIDEILRAHAAEASRMPLRSPSNHRGEPMETLGAGLVLCALFAARAFALEPRSQNLAFESEDVTLAGSIVFPAEPPATFR
jgi:hypothetical protein